MKNKFTTVLFILFLLTGLIIGFIFWKLKSREVKQAKGIESLSEILKLPDDIDISVFSNKKFLELKKYGPKEIKIEQVGRRNPFAPY